MGMDQKGGVVTHRYDLLIGPRSGSSSLCPEVEYPKDYSLLTGSPILGSRSKTTSLAKMTWPRGPASGLTD